MVFRGTIEQLDKAIYDCVCTHCGAKPREQCKARSRKLFTDVVHSPNPHMARVRAGHALIAQQRSEKVAH